MTKLISTLTAVVLALASVALAAPGQGAMGKAAKEAHAKADKPAKESKGDRKGNAKYQKQAIRHDIKADQRELKADEKELKRLKGDLKAAQKAGDLRRASRDRAAISRLEYEIRADRDHIKRDQQDAKRSGKPVARSWWARHLGRNGE